MAETGVLDAPKKDVEPMSPRTWDGISGHELNNVVITTSKSLPSTYTGGLMDFKSKQDAYRSRMLEIFPGMRTMDDEFRAQMLDGLRSFSTGAIKSTTTKPARQLSVGDILDRQEF